LKRFSTHREFPFLEAFAWPKALLAPLLVVGAFRRRMIGIAVVPLISPSGANSLQFY